MLAGMLSNPYAGLVVFVAIPAVFVHRAAAHPGRHAARSGGSCCAIRRRSSTGPSSISAAPASAGRRSSSRRSPPSTSSSSCWPATAACTAMESPSFCGQACHTPMQPQFTGLAARGARAGRLRRVPHRRRGRRVRPRQALRRATARAWWRSTPIRGRFRRAPRCLPAPRRRRARAATSPGRAIGDRHPRDSRVCRRRSEHRDDDRAADAHERRRPSRRVRFTGTPIPPFASSTWRRMRSARRSRTCKVTDAKAQVKEFVAPDTTEQTISARRAPHDGLHRLPQHGRASHLADARESRRQRHRRRDR